MLFLCLVIISMQMDLDVSHEQKYSLCKNTDVKKFD